MAQPAIKVEGAAELAKRLRRAGDKELQAELKEAWREAADEVLSAVRGPNKSGALMGSVRSTATLRSGRVAAGKKSVPYAGPIHWGWPARGIAANTFLLDALDMRETRAIDVVTEHVEKIAAKVQDGA